ncbi:MAG TPA: HIT family protein [Candidatus Limnocylindria bacterium]|jgi:histidine triad (HIT) family protein|nr:HIT family protein [Candidatus Limnocylindria bacterium]
MAGPCVFCQIARGETRAHVVHRGEDVIAFLDRAPLLHGHTLVMPTRHVETLDDLPDELVAPLFAAVRQTSIAVQRALAAEGSFVASNIRVSQSVPHVHAHVVPRNKGDGLFSTRLVWWRQKYASEAEMMEIAAKIRAAYKS